MSQDAKWIETIVRDFINKSPENTLKDRNNERAWTDPLIGFSSGDDSLYQEFKDHIGPFYWTPDEIFNKTFPQKIVESHELTIISWILPQTGQTKSDNRKETEYPSERWARARVYGEEVNEKLRKHVEEQLTQGDIDVVAPMLSPLWGRRDSDRYGFASNWSERHTAFASGLGTFGLCDGLITPKGKAVRIGSAVARIKIEPTERPYKGRHDYCIFFTKGICGKCIERCPAESISKEGHDKTVCHRYTRTQIIPYARSRFGFDSYACGLCQTGVPCESKIPLEADFS